MAKICSVDMGVSFGLRVFFVFLTWQAVETCQEMNQRRETCCKCTMRPKIIFRAARELTDRNQSDTLARVGLNNRLLRLKHQRGNLLHLQVQINVNTNSKQRLSEGHVLLFPPPPKKTNRNKC